MATPVLSFVLAGGEGRRLQPLTKERSKPAVFFGGRYRLIDFALSNLVNSGLTQIKVLTQYRSTSLLSHLARGWPMSRMSGDAFIDAVPAAMNYGSDWYQGTADAIWQNLAILRELRPEHVAIFSADHVYKMDVRPMLEQHQARRAHITIAAVPVPRREASAFGCLQIDDQGRVLSFLEKPADPPGMPDDPDMTLVSMGNSLFQSKVLVEELKTSHHSTAATHDVSRDVLAAAIGRLDVYAYDFRSQLCPGEDEHSRGYWRDVGSIDAYYEASMDLVSIQPHLDLYNPRWPIRGYQPLSGPAKFVFDDGADRRVGTAIDSIVGAGTIVSGGRLVHSVCAHDVRIHSHSEIVDSVLFPDVDVGRGARLRRCIVDRGVRIPPGLVIGEDPVTDRERFSVSQQGVTVVSREALGQLDEFDVDVADQPEPEPETPATRPMRPLVHRRPFAPTARHGRA
jgi:glucose-1-phosphate adenylyltransferase